MVGLLKIEDHHYRYTGRVKLWLEDCKTIMIDGERYVNTKRDLVEFDLDTLYETDYKYWDTWSLNMLGLYGVDELKIEYYSDVRCGKFIHSSNNYAQAFCSLKDYGYDYNLVATNRDHRYSFNDWKCNLSMTLALEYYGGHNYIACLTSYSDILKYYNKEIRNRIKMDYDLSDLLLPKKELDEIEKSDLLLKYINGINPSPH